MRSSLFTLTNAGAMGSLLFTGLLAGLFFSWSIAVMPGIRKLPDSAFIAAMQAMNRAILNPVFLIVFLGAPLLAVVHCIVLFKEGQNPAFYTFLCGTVCLLLGVIAVTIGGNVPLNEKLESFPAESSFQNETAMFRAAFEKPWNTLNNLRTVFSIIAFFLMGISLILRR